MARAQTLVQLTDDLLAALDERAARRGVSRSQLIREALDAYLKNDRDAQVDAAIIEGYTQIPPSEHEAWAKAAGRRSIQAEPW